MSSFLFLLSSYADIDHIVPLVWKSLTKGHRALVVFDRPYACERDFRFQFLMRYSNFEILDLWGVKSPSRPCRVLGKIVWNSFTLRKWLARRQVSACFFEWGEGLQTGGGIQFFTRLKQNIELSQVKKSVGWKTSVRQSPIVKQFEALLLKPLRTQILAAARASSIPTFALPHGVFTKLNVDYNPKIAGVMNRNDGQLPHEDRNSFTAWVFTSEFHRQLMIRYARMNPSVGQTWGSLRFCKDWMEILKEICPQASLPPPQSGQVRLVFFLPKWRNHVTKPETIDLLNSIALRDDVQLVLKTHPRKGTADLDGSDLEELLQRPNVVLAGDAHSTALVRASDVVVDVGTGMAVDAIVQQKHLIYPAYLHTNKLVFDEYGGCLIARNQTEVHRFLDTIVEREESPLASSEVQLLINKLVYGDRDPFDVPEFYYGQVQSYVAKGDRLARPNGVLEGVS